MLSKLECLQQVTIFQNLSDDQLKALALCVRHRHFDDGEVIFREGDPSLSLFIVSSGEVKVTEHRPVKDDLRLATVKPYGVLGELGILDGGPRSATATAIGTTDLLVLAQSDIMELLDNEPAVVRSVLVAVVGIVRASNKRMIVITSHDVPARMSFALLDLAELHGRPVKEGILIDKDVSPAELAEQTALHVTSVKRWLRDMEYDDVLRHEVNRYIVRRPEVLRRALPVEA